MKKALIAILTVLFLFNCTGAGLIWLSRINSHRAIVKTKKHHGPRVTIRFASSSENSARYFPGKEFETGGKRYDVISVKKEGAELVLTCFDDTKEKKMLNELAKNTDSQNSDKQKNNSQKKAGQDYLVSVFNPFRFPFHFSEYPAQPVNFASSVPRTIPAPPPWFV